MFIVLATVGLVLVLCFVLPRLKKKYLIWRADRAYVEQADKKELGKEFQKIAPFLDKDMERILKLMNRKERRAFLKANSNTIKKLNV